jgi:DNA polymerase elongation subunit (family B)
MSGALDPSCLLSKTDKLSERTTVGNKMSVLCPCDWIDHDDFGKYVIDVYGRTDEGDTAMLRIRGYKPYFYVGSEYDFTSEEELSKQNITKIKVTNMEKYDVFAGYNGYIPTKVQKIEVESMKDFRAVTKIAKDAYEDGKAIYTIYEANLPPLLRFYHDHEIAPASPVAFIPGQKIKNQERAWYVDSVNIKSKPSADTPLKIAAYDIECTSGTGQFPVPEKDPVIQIGITMRWSNSMMTNISRKVFVLGTVAPSEDPSVEFRGHPTEADMIEAFQEYVQEENPDVICGYNTYGFDDRFLAIRAKVNGMKLNLARGSIWGEILQKKTFELASGKYEVEYLKTPGRLTVDLLLNMRREHTLDSYKLDNVASVFLRDKVLKFEGTTVHTKTTRGLHAGNYVRFDLVGNTMNPYQEGRKFLVKSLTPKSFTIDETELFADLDENEKKTLEWSFTKDDLHHLELFKMHKGSAKDRAVIAKYCIQDCDLVLTLMAKLDTLVNARGMADVCFVPLQFLFLRGQGIKIFSRVAYEASKRNQIILTQEALVGDGIGYEGAIVISPKIGMYLETPVAVLDFNSLYPSSMIGENLSPDTFLFKKTYSKTGKLVSYEGMPADKVKGLDGYHEISYDEEGCKCICAYMQPTDDQPLSFGLIPMALQIMLKKRKEARKKMEDPALDDAQKSVYNGLQLAYKVVANSIYGQLGSRTSAIRKMCVAASTTAVGRRSLLFAKSTVEADGGNVIYGDTDSIFITYSGKDLVKTIKKAQEDATKITSLCPHKAFVIGYEKTFYPFILFCRKRYVGMKYEEDPTKCKRASMGIVLRRRDNAPIVKDVYGGALDIILEEKDVKKAAAFVKDMLIKVMKSELPIEKLAITKQLRDDYKAMEKDYKGHATIPAHRLLADRMTKRDPGNAPSVGERLQYVFIQTDKKLQADRIETIEFVKKNKLTLDSTFYVTNQIQNPVAQLFALCIDQLDGYREPSRSYASMLRDLLEDEVDLEEATLSVLKHKEKQLDSIMFLKADYIQNIIRASRSGPLDNWFKKK